MAIPNYGNIFTAKPTALVSLLQSIEKHDAVLPNFQRAWVWEPEMVRDLLISVAHLYPAGSLLTMPVSSTHFALRAFEGAGEFTSHDRPNLMILDGQQRLTSLYQALYRREGVQVKRQTYHFYLDIRLLMSESAGTAASSPFSQALFYVKEEASGKRVRYDRIQPLYPLTTQEDELAAGCLPLNLLFDTSNALTAWQNAYLVRNSQKDMDEFLRLQADWARLVDPWLNSMKSYPFPEVQLDANMPLGAICHIFEKVNSTGVALDVFDLCTAILWAKGFALNEEWKKTCKGLDQANFLSMLPRPLSGTYFLQAIALLDSLERKRSASRERIAVACRKEDLMALSVETVKKWWGVLVEGYKEASKFMTNEGILDERILPYTTLIFPLAAIFADVLHRKGAAHIGAAWPKVAQWYWCSVFSQRYSSHVETAAAQDFEEVLAWIEGGTQPYVVRTFNFRSDALQEITSIRNAIYKGILCLLVRDGARDFGGGGKLSTDLFYDTKQDHHHIFPTDVLKQMGVQSDRRTDTIINKTLISASVNRSISNKHPSRYVQMLIEKVGQQTTDEILHSHRINPALLKQDNWEAFLQDRRERLRDLVVTACGGNVQPFLVSVPDALLAGESDDEDSVA